MIGRYSIEADGETTLSRYGVDRVSGGRPCSAGAIEVTPARAVAPRLAASAGGRLQAERRAGSAATSPASSRPPPASVVVARR